MFALFSLWIWFAAITPASLRTEYCTICTDVARAVKVSSSLFSSRMDGCPRLYAGHALRCVSLPLCDASKYKPFVCSLYGSLWVCGVGPEQLSEPRRVVRLVHESCSAFCSAHNTHNFCICLDLRRHQLTPLRVLMVQLHHLRPICRHERPISDRCVSVILSALVVPHRRLH